MILLVDDDVRVRTLLADMLDMLDHRVEMADTGEEALTCMDGAELYRRIGEQWPHLARRVAFVTGRAPNDLGLRSGESVPILGKPFSFESLEAAVTAILARAT